MKKFICFICAVVVASTTIPVVKRAWAASCLAGAGDVCVEFPSLWNRFTYVVTGGSTARSDLSRWVDNWISAPEAGIDCSGRVDSTAAMQALVNLAAWNKSLHINMPLGCKVTLSKTITAGDTSGLTISSQSFAGDGVGTPAQFIWNGPNGGDSCASDFSRCVYMFDIENSDHPVFQNLLFADGRGCPDGFLKFDGAPKAGAHEIGTNGRIIGNAFSNGNCKNPNFVAVNLSQTTTSNHENYIIQDNYVSCGNGLAAIYARDGVTNGTPTVTSKSAPFSRGDVGKRIRLSYAGGSLDTTIASFVDPSTVTLSSAPSWSQANVTIVVGTSFGIGYRNGASQNALQQQFIHLQYSRCAYGIYVAGGNVQISQPTGGQSDIGIFIAGWVAQNVSIDYYASEDDFQAIVLQKGNVAPISISNSRFSNGNQMANGHVILSNAVTFTNNLFNFDPRENAVLIGLDGNPVVMSVNNKLRALSWERVGYSAFTSPPLTSFNDDLDQTTNPGQQIFGCWNKHPPCLRITNTVGHAGGTGVEAFSGNQYADSTTAIIGIRSTGIADYISSFTALQGIGTPGRFAGTQTAVEATWDAKGINATGAGAQPTAAYGFRARTPASVSGALPALYGLYIDEQKVPHVAAGWGVYQAGAGDKNYFGGPMILANSSPPKSSTADCEQGAVTWDANFIYVCVAKNSWKRSAVSSW